MDGYCVRIKKKKRKTLINNKDRKGNTGRWQEKEVRQKTHREGTNLMPLIKDNSEPLSPEQRSVHVFLELCHQGPIGGEDNVLVLKLQRDQRLALTVMHKNVQVHAVRKNILF